jgi:hypothetical protein
VSARYSYPVSKFLCELMNKRCVGALKILVAPRKVFDPLNLVRSRITFVWGT